MTEIFATERRQITVLFCDLVGSTELSLRLDPEEVREIMLAFLKVCSSHIEQSGGFVARFTGDGVLAYFGYPAVGENDAERALYAALKVSVWAAQLAVRNGYVAAVRIGVATGLTVVGDLVGAGSIAAERLVVGVAPNLAARLQGCAKPGQIVVADSTQHLTSGVFAFRSLGKRRLKGFSEPQAVWELVGPRPTTLRFTARLRKSPTPLVGREDDMRRLSDCWTRCVGGQGGLVSIVGEPGIGKSRLLYELRQRVATAPHVWIEGGGALVFRNTPFHGVAQMIQGLRDGVWLAPELAATRRQTQHLPPPDDRSWIVDIADSMLETLAALRDATFAGGRRELLNGLAERICFVAARAPTILAIEDLHWMDPSSVELLEVLLATTSKLLVVCTSRESLPAEWVLRESTGIILQRLVEAETRQVIAATAVGLRKTTVRSLVERSGGVPLFAEELARLIVDRATEPTDSEIPASLSDLLLSRLESAGPARRLAQVASVLGGEFRIDLLGAMAEVEMTNWREALEELHGKQILGARREGLNGFRHSLIRDAAYGGMLRSDQAALHRRAAVAMSARFPDLIESNPELLAQHWEAAGDDDQAQGAWWRAGGAAAARQAYAEAQHAYQRSLTMLARTDESASRAEQELQLQAALARILQITQGYSAPSTMATTARAHQLAERAGDLPGRLQNVLTTWVGTSSAGDYDTGLRLADQLSLLAQVAEGGEWLGAASMAQVTTRYRVGDLTGAEEAFIDGQAHFQRPEFDALPGAYAQTYGNAAIIAWLLGSDADARQRIELVLAHSRDDRKPYEVAFGSFMAATVFALLDAPEAALTLAQHSIAVSEERFPQFSANGHVALGHALTRLGRPSDGVSALAEGLSRMGLTQGRAGVTMYLTWLAEAQLELGADDAASTTINKALAVNPWERFYRPEALRMRAELLARGGERKAASRALAASLADASAMNALALLRRSEAMGRYLD